MHEQEFLLLERIKHGDDKSFEVIVERFTERGMSLAMRLLKNTEDAEDALQEAFVKLYRAVMDGSFERRSKLSTYFYRIVYNTALDKLRKLKHAPAISYDESEGDEELAFAGTIYGTPAMPKAWKQSHDRSQNPDKHVLDSQVREFVNTFMALLPEKYSVILTMFYVNDLTHDEISETLRLPLGTVKNRIFRAKEKLKELILEKYSPNLISEFLAV